MTDLATPLPEEPALGDLRTAISRAGIDGLIVNSLLCVLTLSVMAPSLLPLNGLLSRILEFAGFPIEVDDVLAKLMLFGGAILISAWLDVIVNLHRIHDAAQEFIERNEVCTTVALLVGRFNTVAIDTDGEQRILRDWASAMLQKTARDNLPGRLLIIVGVFLYAVAGLAPWIAVCYYLGEPQWWTLLVLVKVPLWLNSVSELLLMAARRHSHEAEANEELAV